MALVERSCSPLWGNLPVESLFASDGGSPTGQSRYCAFKSWLDRALGVVLLLLLSPVLVVLMIAVKLSSRGPAIYRQKRVGLAGRNFVMYKLRSMRLDAESGSGPRWAAAGDDPRVTPLGYWLRRLHLDELPQLINLVRGEMSLVGPRPERPEFVSVLAHQIPNYLDRLQVLPGITGLAQVNLPPDADLESVRRKLLLDLEYIHTSSFGLDVRLVLCTALRLIGIRGGATSAWLGLQRPVAVEANADPSLESSMTPEALAASDGLAERFVRVAETAPVRERPPAAERAESGIVTLRS